MLLPFLPIQHFCGMGSSDPIARLKIFVRRRRSRASEYFVARVKGAEFGGARFR
jgi:hypothetical protein